MWGLLAGLHSERVLKAASRLDGCPFDQGLRTGLRGARNPHVRQYTPVSALRAPCTRSARDAFKTRSQELKQLTASEYNVS
jgi:hypothetical protein